MCLSQARCVWSVGAVLRDEVAREKNGPIDRERPFIEGLSCKHQSHNSLASGTVRSLSSQRQRSSQGKHVRQPRRPGLCARDWCRASGEFRIAGGEPNAYSDTWNGLISEILV